MREVLNAIFYVLRGGIPWRMLPETFPPASTVYRWFATWRDNGVFEDLNHRLVMMAREQAGRGASPTASVIDSQSVKTSEAGGPRDYDAGKKIKGRKRHAMVDTDGHALALHAQPASREAAGPDRSDGIDRTAKLYIGGKQKRPDSGYSEPIAAADGSLLGEVPLGNRKDVRDAVEAARKAVSWELMDGHARAQVLYYVGENLMQRRDEFAGRLARMTGSGRKDALLEVEAGVEAAFSAAAWADKYEGAVHNPPGRVVTMALHEPLGVVGIVCPVRAPLAGFLSLALHAAAMGNRVVAIPSPAYPLIATDLYQIFDTSDVPAGVVNIVSGRSHELAMVLAGHGDVDGLWYFGAPAYAADIIMESVSNLKRVWTHENRLWPWEQPNAGQVQEILRQAVQIKNVWVPYGA